MIIEYLIILIQAMSVCAVIGLIIIFIGYWLEYKAIKQDEHENESVG